MPPTSPRAPKHRPANPLAPCVLCLLLAASLLGCGTPDARQDLAWHRAVNALSENRPELARGYFAQHLREHPDDAQAWRLAGDAWMSGTLRSPSRAADCWLRYLELETEDGAERSQVTLALAETHLLMGDWERAADLLPSIGNSARARHFRIQLFLELDAERAVEAVEEELDRESAAFRHDPAFESLAARAFDQTGDWQRALVHAERAVAGNPLDLQSTYVLARARQRAGDAELARELLDTHQLLSRLTGAGSTPAPGSVESLRLLDTLAPRLNMDAVPVQLLELRLLVESGRHGEARERLPRLADQLDVGTRLEIAGLANRAGASEIAGTQLRIVYETLSDSSSETSTPDAGWADRANLREALFGLALLAYQEGDLEQVDERIGEARERFPESARFHHLAGQVALDRGDTEQAEASLRRAVELGPWKTDCRLELASLWLADGRLDEAETLLAEAPGDDPAVAAYRRQHGLR